MNSPRRTISADSPRKKIKDVRRLQLIDAAMESIARHSLSETTIGQISETAGMSRGIVNFYFKTKEQMLQETLSHLLKEQANAWRDAHQKHQNALPLLCLRECIRSLFGARLCSRKKLAVWSAFVAHAATHPTYRYIFEVETGPIRADIAALAERADPHVDAQSFALGLIAYVRGFRTELLIGNTDRSRLDLEQETLAFLGHLTETPAKIEKKSAPKKSRVEAVIEDGGMDDLFAVGEPTNG